MRSLLRTQLGAGRHVLVPRRRLEIIFHFDHRDAVGHRADDLAEVAADAFALVDARYVRRVLEPDALVRAVLAGRDAQVAPDAFARVDLRDGLVVQIEIAPLRIRRHRLADEVVELLEAVRAHVLLEALDHVLDDAITAQHDLGAHLDRARAEEQELDGVAPVGDAADAADGQA